MVRFLKLKITPKAFVKNSKTTFKNSRRMVFKTIDFQNSPLRRPKVLPHFNFRGHMSFFWAENTTISWVFKAENSAQTNSEQLLNKLKKSSQNGFFETESVKNCSFRRPNFDSKISMLEAIHQPFEQKIHPNVRLLRP